MSMIRKATLATALAASAIATSTPAMARDHYYRRGNDTAAWAIGAGILGVAIGAIAASSNNRDRYYRRDYDGDYYYRDGYYHRDGRRYDRDEWNRYQRNYDRDQWRRGYDRDGYYRRGY